MSSDLIHALSFLVSGTVGLAALILSGLSGGFFAGLFNYRFESKRSLEEKRSDKFFDHRNSLVQIEQELIPLRVDMSRNIQSLEDALKNTNETNIRFILRFYHLNFSTGLGLKILDVSLINKYAQLYSAIESLNSDIQYITNMVNWVVENSKNNKHDDSIIFSYVEMIKYLDYQCKIVDDQTMELLTLAIHSVGQEDEHIKEKYIGDGKAVAYKFNKIKLGKIESKLKEEESPGSHRNERQPKFFAPFLDLKKIIIPA